MSGLYDYHLALNEDTTMAMMFLLGFLAVCFGGMYYDKCKQYDKLLSKYERLYHEITKAN